MSAWLDWIYEIALSRVDTIERELYAHPEHSPKFSEAVRELHAALDETEEHPNAALTGRDEIWMGYTAALALEMYYERTGEFSADKRALMDMLLARIDGILEARGSKYIMLHAPKDKIEEVVKLLPGAEHPTLLPMADDDTKIVMHMVSRETLFWETMEKLKALGASSILVLPIEKMLK